MLAPPGPVGKDWLTWASTNLEERERKAYTLQKWTIQQALKP